MGEILEAYNYIPQKYRHFITSEKLRESHIKVNSCKKTYNFIKDSEKKNLKSIEIIYLDKIGECQRHILWEMKKNED